MNEEIEVPVELSTTAEELNGYIRELVSRALGAPPTDPYFQRHLEMGSDAEISILLERAAGHVSMGSNLPDHSRFRFLKRLVLRVSRVFAGEQEVFNRTTVALLERIKREVDLRANLGAGAHANLTTIEVVLEELRDEITQLRSRLEKLDPSSG